MQNRGLIYSDIFTSGTCATTASLLIAVLTFIFFWLNLYPAIPFRVSPRVQAASLLFASLFLLGSMIPYMIFFLHGRASVKAFIGQIQLPDGIVKNVQNASGMDGVYKKFHYRQCGFSSQNSLYHITDALVSD
jgi:hypothetical protein